MTWNFFTPLPSGGKIEYVKIFVTSQSYNRIKINDGATNDDKNPFSDSAPDANMIDVTSEAKNGYLCDVYVEPGYTVGCVICYGIPHVVDYGDYELEYTVYGFDFLPSDVRTSNCLATSNAPDISYQNGQIKIGRCMNGRRIIEFEKVGIDYGDATGVTDKDTTHEFLLTSFVNMEGNERYLGYYKLDSVPVLHRFNKNRLLDVSIRYQSTIHKAEIDNAIDNALNELTQALSASNIRFRKYEETTAQRTVDI